MRKLILLAGAAALLLAAPATATTVSVAIDKKGFAPASITLRAGDSITWTNKDKANHQVVCKACPFTSPVLKPGDNYSFTFVQIGSFTLVDPLNKNKKLKVTVKKPAATVTIAVAPTAATYGKTATVSGAVSTGKAGEKVDIFAFRCLDQIVKRVATVTTKSGGAYNFPVHPPITTWYSARYGAPTGTVVSPSAMLGVRPFMTLKKNSPGKFTVEVAAGQSLVGKAVAFQRYLPKRKRKWVTVRTLTLQHKTGSDTPVAGTVVSSQSFTSKLKKGLRVRAVLPPAQAVPCYVAASSKTIKT
jgi:plastocyanin